MSALFHDVLAGNVDPKRANAACNVASVMLKAAELDLKHRKAIGNTENEADSETLEQLRVRIHDYMAELTDPVKPAVIALDLGVPRAMVQAALEFEWFKKSSRGYSINTQDQT